MYAIPSKLLLTLALLPPTQTQTQDSLRLELPPGLEARLWAESPQLYNPTALDVDERGRLWVTEAVNYRKWGGRNPGREHEAGDRVLVLADTDGDGLCDSSKVFAQGPELVAPLGICVLGGGRVLVSCSPSAILYTDEDGDDMADRQEVFLTGFGGHDHDHGLHSFVRGPDGALYVAAGNAGPHLVTDRAGWKLRSGSIYVGGGEFTADNKPGLLSDDGRAWTGGLALRVGQDGRGLEVLAHNFRNDYELALDSYGNLFLSDNDDDGNQGCRTLWAMEGGNYGYFSEDGTRTWQADRRPGQSTPSAHWHQDDPGVCPAGTINGAGGPTGVCVYEGTLLEEWIDGAVLNADAGAGVVYAHQPRLEGAGLALDPGWLVRGAPGTEERSARWFRPSDVCVGTDGAVYVADWYDPGVGGHAAGDREAYGRILRIAPAKNRTTSPRIDLTSVTGPIEAFFSDAPSVRAMGARVLAEASDLHRAALLRALELVEDPRRLARVLFVLAGYDEAGRAAVARYLEDPDARLRIAALRALRAAGANVLDHLWSLARDPSPAVRREVLVALRRHAEAENFPALMLVLARAYDGTDRNYLEAFGSAARGCEKELYALLSAELGNTPSRWDARFAGLAWRLHPAAAAPAFAARAADRTLSAEARLQALDALAFIPERPAAEAMANLALLGEGAVGQRAVWWVRQRDTNDWREYQLALQLEQGDFAQAELAFDSGPMRSGTQVVRVELERAERLWLVVGDGGDGNSCDWADWIEPRFVTSSGDVRLTEAGWVAAQAEWGEVRLGQSAGGGELRAGGEAVTWGIGTHAKSTIEFAVPRGARSFECRVGPDEGGTSQQGGASTSVEFRVYVQRPRDRSAILANETLLRDDGADLAAREASVRALAGDPEGGLILIQSARKGELPASLVAAAQEAIFSNPDISVRALASEVFARPGEAQASLPPIQELLELSGDSARGRRVFQGEQALCATCHTFDGLGRDIGPDLTAIRTKYSRAELFDTILNPSAGIAFGYESWLFDVEGEGYMSGFVLADGEDVVLKDTMGLRHVIAREDVRARERQALSIMPQGVALGLGAQGLADLVAFLVEDRSAPPVYGQPVVLFDGTNLEAWTYHLADPGAKLADVWSLEPGGVLRCKGNPIGYLKTKDEFLNFRLELEWRFDPQQGAGNSGVLLRRVGPDKVWPKSIEAQLHSRDAGDIWNIDAVAMLVEPSRTSGRRTVKAAPCNERPLGEWNRYAITLDRGDLTLEINGDVQNTARWCEEISGNLCLQSEGAEIHFRNVVLYPIVGHGHH
jgi:putative membrane-bound dehydrogenase-like protein